MSDRNGPAAKPLTINPLKTSPALGGAVAFLGVDRCLPLLHGAQGCTAFALVLAVRHFREAIPLQTTAIAELDAILGGADNLEQAITNIYGRAGPRLIGLLSTALTETRDDDIAGELRRLRGRHVEWADLDVVFASTPDFAGGFAEGWARTVEALIAEFVTPGPRPRLALQVNLLAGSHLTPADVEALKDTIAALGLSVIALPDLSTSLDGFAVDAYVPTSGGGTAVEDIRRMGQSALTLAVGEHMRAAAAWLHDRCGVPFQVFDGLIGLEAADAFLSPLLALSPMSDPPERMVRERGRLVDAMLDGHGWFAGRRVAIATEADLAIALSHFLSGLGAHISVVVTPTRSPLPARLRVERHVIGDFDDLEGVVRATGGCDLVIGNSHAAPVAGRLGVPLFRAGFPVYDRLGVPQRVSVGYAGSRQLLFDLANLFIAAPDRHGRHSDGAPREGACPRSADAPAAAH
jgi:nitrogenase molybdenum-iron protein NifN